MKTLTIAASVVPRGLERSFSFREGVRRPSLRVSCKLLVGMAMMCGAPALAEAERAVFAEVPATAPFDAAQLTEALRLRLPADGEPVRVRVAIIAVASGGAGVRIEARGNAREVALGGLIGAAAARLVALAADDLLLDDLAIEPVASRALMPIESSRARPTIGVLGGAAAWQSALGGVQIDIALPRDAWLFAIEAGGATLIDGPLGLTAAVVRLGGGVRLGALELRAGATLAPVIVSEGAGDQTILLGAGASARLRLPLSSSVRVVVATGGDVFATRTTYVRDGMQVLTTPRAAPWLAVGMEVTP
jgi:hypothetical protein